MCMGICKSKLCVGLLTQDVQRISEFLVFCKNMWFSFSTLAMLTQSEVLFNVRSWGDVVVNTLTFLMYTGYRGRAVLFQLRGVCGPRTLRYVPLPTATCIPRKTWR